MKKKTYIALAGAALVLTATPAIAAQVILAGPFKNSGGCNWWVASQGGDSHGANDGISCQKIGGQWFAVYG